MKKTTTGFTLVELLIVIVVIAILAAISIVTYNGIQERATMSALRSDISQASRQFEVYKATEGRYPATQQERQGLNVRFSFSPVGSNVLWCGDSDGERYAIFVRRQPGARDGIGYIHGQGMVNTSANWPAAGTTNSYWSGTNLCPYAGISGTNTSAWGTSWVNGG